MRSLDHCHSRHLACATDLLNVLHGAVGSAVSNVLGYRGAEQHRFLGDDADLLSQPGDVQLSHTASVQQNLGGGAEQVRTGRVGDTAPGQQNLGGWGQNRSEQNGSETLRPSSRIWEVGHNKSGQVADTVSKNLNGKKRCKLMQGNAEIEEGLSSKNQRHI